MTVTFHVCRSVKTGLKIPALEINLLRLCALPVQSLDTSICKLIPKVDQKLFASLPKETF